MKKCYCLLCVVTFIMLALSSYCNEGSAITIQGVEGRGKTRQLALADAFRNAISQAIGTYVVTSRKWDGETLDKKIFDNSDAVVKSHKVVDENEVNGKWSLTIDAEIVRNEMMKYIQKEISTEVGEGELANLLAKRNAINNAVGSLELLFQNWRENIYRMEKYGNISISDQDVIGSDTVHISVPFIVTFHWDAYQTFLNKVRNVLSRIAIGKTQGVYDCRKDEDFRKKNYPFYHKVGLAYKGEYGIETKNPNGYGEIRILSHFSEQVMQYEIYVVPGQVKATLDSLLQREAEIKFSFTSKGGVTIASRIVKGEVFFWGWWWICDDNAMQWSSNSDGFELLTLMDVIKTALRTGSSYEESSACKLYHASIPVPLNAAASISGCSITAYHVNDKQEYNDRNHITTEPMDMDEWIRIDKKPLMTIPNKNIQVHPKNTTSQSRRTTASKTGNKLNTEKEVRTVTCVTVSEKDRNLKELILELCRLPPDFSAAGKWFKIAKGIESDELRQLALRTSGAALFHAKRTDVYNSSVKPLLKEPSSLEELFYVSCSSCDGKETIEKKCMACGGSGTCKYSNCRDGKHLVHKMGGDYYEKCRGCNGSGRCQKCGGTGMRNVKCSRCNGKGVVFSRDKAAEIYHNCVETISQAFQ